ncbi:MAG: polysaccharide biosynthesis protein [Chloroflexota bacterium]
MAPAPETASHAPEIPLHLAGSTILITGGTGSFGNRVARYLLEQDPAEIRIFSRDEKKQWEMQKTYPNLRYIVGDVRDRDRLRDAMEGVDFVFHAAALKQVPSCEAAPAEALKTNTLGSLNVCDAAAAAGVRTVVALSTDKAVKPVNAMGMTKALMEKIVCAQNLYRSSPIFTCVRYGNVMGSRGSVIPLFREQIRRDQPITVTLPQMTRFMLTLDDSVELVVRALTTANGGEIFVRKAPACTVQTLAEVMRRKYSPRGDDHEICEVGVRPGEKIHEVLVNEYELPRSVEDDNYFVVHPEYRPPATLSQREPGEEYTSENTTRIEEYETISALLDHAEATSEYN